MIFQIQPYIRMQWVVSENATAPTDYRVLPASRRATITTGSTFPVFILAQARCDCSLMGGFLRNEIHFPQVNVDVKLYSDSDHDTFDPDGKDFRDTVFGDHFSDVRRGTTKVQVEYFSGDFLFTKI
jgi:hypothetical protein